MRLSSCHLRQLIEDGWPTWAPLLDQAVLAKPSPLDPIELRYLRLRAGWSASELVKALGVSSNVTVSRWEGGARRIPAPTQRLLRLLVGNALGIPSLRSLAKGLTFPWRQTSERLEIDIDPEKGVFEYRWAVMPKKLPKPMERLLWDTSPHGLDLQRHADYIIARVLEKGDLEDWNWLRWTYGGSRILAVVSRNTKLSPQTIHLWQNVLLT